MKWVHILSSTILFGFGAGTAWYMLNAHLTRDPVTIASIGRMVVRADWIFTGTSGIIQPASGLYLAFLLGYDLLEPWLVLTYILYGVAFVCWVPVVSLQIKAQSLAAAAVEQSKPLGPDYFSAMRLWFILGWPAFLALIGVFWLMIARPVLFT
ncbi:DUF2269 domain-containing protein [Parasphingorhabdus sp.]|uniref:DUF2269 family protein n=1 Tax=Parasphingorhabdus sp. TaxID=2709688 RepID=UPI003264D75D